VTRDTHADDSRSAEATPGLRHNYLNLVENLAQTLGVLTPSGTISVIIPLLILSAGNATWLLLLVTLTIFMLIMLTIMRFASLYSSAGSLAAFSRLGWGPRGGLIGGWIYLLGISFCVPAAIVVSASYFDLLLAPWLGPSVTTVRIAILTVLLTIAGWLAAHRDIRLSTHLMLFIECTSVSLMVFLMVAGMVHANAWVDQPQLHLAGAHFSGFQGGIVLAFMLMAGFEGTTSLGEEARDPKKTIPRAILTCMLPLSGLYLLMTYCLVALGNRGLIGAQANGLTVPFDNIARSIGLGWLGPLSSLGVALSYFACGLASLTVAGRVLFSMAREGQFWSEFGEAHPRNATPHRAIALVSVVSMAIPVAMLLQGSELALSINVLSQMGSFGMIGGYLLVAIALPVYLKRRGLLKANDLFVAAAASALLLFVLVLSVYPVPPAPYCYLAYLFLACTLAGLAISALRGTRSAAGLDGAQMGPD
jgi:amino acid transporter